MHASAGNMPNISIWTVRCILRKVGLGGRVAAKKPLLNRLLWCKSYLEMDVGSWRNFIFLVEAHLKLYFKRRQYVRRLVGQRLQSKYTSKTVKYGGPPIFVWRAISVVKVPPILNSKDYQTVLDRFLIPLLKNDSIFMQDKFKFKNF